MSTLRGGSCICDSRFPAARARCPIHQEDEVSPLLQYCYELVSGVDERDAAAFYRSDIARKKKGAT